MGNELFKKYTIDNTPFLQSGFLSLWSVYHGIHNEKREPVCIFLIEKKKLKHKFPKKSERNEIIKILKKDPDILAQYKHNNLLRIVEPVIEDKFSIGFITEEIKTSLSTWYIKSSPSKLEIKTIITQIVKCVSFFNEKCSLCVCGLNPSCIFLTNNNEVRISGFSQSQPEGNCIDYSVYNSISFCNSNLCFIAPEIVLNKKAYSQSDVFSIGCMIFTLLKRYINDKNKYFLNNPKTLSQYKNEIDNYGNNLLKINFTKEENDVLNEMLNQDHSKRKSLKEILTKESFNDINLKALDYIANICSNKQEDNIKFLTKLPECIMLFENKIIERKILKYLIKALENFKDNKDIIIVLLPCIFTICEMPMVKVNFETLVWPKIKLLFILSSFPSNCLYYLINKIPFLGDKLSQIEFESTFLNVICQSINSNIDKLQICVIDNLCYLSKKISKDKFSNEIFPRAMSILTNSNSNSIKISILTAIENCFTELDNTAINDILLPNLMKVNLNEINFDVYVELIKIYESIANIVTINSIAMKILPVLINIIYSGNIDKATSERILSLIERYLNIIKDSRENDFNNFKSVVDIESIRKSDKQENNTLSLNEIANKVDNKFFLSFFKERENGNSTEIKENNKNENDEGDNEEEFNALYMSNNNKKEIQLQLNSNNENLLTNEVITNSNHKEDKGINIIFNYEDTNENITKMIFQTETDDNNSNKLPE